MEVVVSVEFNKDSSSILQISFSVVSYDQLLFQAICALG